MDNVALRFRWRPATGQTAALQGRDGDSHIGYIEQAIDGDFWLWFMTFGQGATDIFKACHLNGAAPSAALAAAACEASYEAHAGR